MSYAQLLTNHSDVKVWGPARSLGADADYRCVVAEKARRIITIWTTEGEPIELNLGRAGAVLATIRQALNSPTHELNTATVGTTREAIVTRMATKYALCFTSDPFVAPIMYVSKVGLDSLAEALIDAIDSIIYPKERQTA